MTMLKRNIFANLFGGAWIAVLTLVITPLQVNLLGIKAYGLIGFITTLQIILSVLDLGLSSTITRELAGDHSLERVASRPLLRTALLFYWGIAVLIGVILATCSGEIARAWFNPNTIDMIALQRGLLVVAVILALRWPVALYSGVLAGVHRMDVLNFIKAGVAAVRLLGGILVLLAWRDLDVFLGWSAFSAFVEVLVFAIVCRRLLPEMNWRPGFSLTALRAVWGFSLSMNALALLGMGITQLDRLLISKMLTLEDLGHYSLAYSSATSISLILSALSTALMPSFAAAHGANMRETLLQRYDIGNRVMLYATGLVLFTLLFFGEPLLHLWVNQEAAAGAWRSLALLAVGFWFSASVSNAYNVGVACRQTRGIIKLSAISAILYAPVLYGMIYYWGIEGAAAAWLLLNVGYTLVIVPMVHRSILSIPVAPWFYSTLLPFVVLGTTTFGIARLFANYLLLTPEFELLIIIPAIIGYIGIGYFFLGDIVRAEILQILRQVFKIKLTAS